MEYLIGNLEKINIAFFDSTKEAVELTINLLGTICLWNGIINIISKTSIMDSLIKIINPIINILFPKIKNNNKIKKEISMNIIANVLGLGNAATPIGIKAMKSLQEINKSKEKISDTMAMLIILNTASIQLIPTTVIGIRSSLGSKNPTSIIFCVWISTILAAISGIISTKFFIKINNKEK